MKGLIVAVAAVLALSAGQAAADGLPSKGAVRSAPSATPNWNGFYVGVGIGGGQLVVDSTTTAFVEGVPVDSLAIEERGDGLFGTVTIGYDRVIRPGWVAGVFADYDFGSTITIEASGVDHNHSWSMGGRLGFLADPSSLLYLTAGYSQAELSAVGGGSTTFNGYFVGAGVEALLRQNWSLKLEYRYANLGEENAISERPNEVVLITTDLDPSIHTARLVLSYRFGQ